MRPAEVVRLFTIPDPPNKVLIKSSSTKEFFMCSQHRLPRSLRKRKEQFFPNRRAATTVEYAVMLLAVLAVILGMVVLLGSRAGWLWSANSAQLDPVLRGDGPLSQLPPADDGDTNASPPDSNLSAPSPPDAPTDPPTGSGSEARGGTSSGSEGRTGAANRSGRQRGRGRSR